MIARLAAPAMIFVPCRRGISHDPREHTDDAIALARTRSPPRRRTLPDRPVTFEPRAPMCGRYVSPNQAAIERYWHIGRHNSNPFEERFNVAPTTMVPVVYLEDGETALREARWGLVPHWWKQPKLPGMTFNARSEEAATKPMWRHAYAHSRCLVPARGWYEWQRRETLDTRTGEVRIVKQPYFLHGRDPLLAFAGLLGFWTRPEGEKLVSCSVLTRAAAGIAALVHERMPVALAPDDRPSWLDPALSKNAVGELVAGSVTDIGAYPVSTRVNSTRNNSPELIESVGEALA
jgi:putative SOS response-associated peptidase YedK